MASRPPGIVARQNPIVSFAGWDDARQVASTLRELESGQFRNSAILSDQFGRDDRIDGVLRTRVDELLSTQLDILPADDRKKSIRIADMLGGVEDGPGEWDRMCPTSVLSKLLRTGLCLNFALAQILWTQERGMFWPRLKFWNSQNVYWNTLTESFWVRQLYGPEIELPRLDQNPIGDGQWFIWCPFGYQEAWLGGYVRSLAPMYMRRMWLNRDWSRSSELYGQGILKAIVPADEATSESGDAFAANLANRGSESVVKCPQGAEGQKYDIELEVAAQQIYKTFMDGKGDVNVDIAVAILGQNLTTESPGGGMSNGGDQKGPRAVLLSKARQDAAIATAIRDQVLVPWARFNFSDPDLAPLPIYRVDPPDDDVKKATVLKTVGEALSALQLAKAPIDVRATSEEFGLRLVSVEEQAANEAIAAEEAQARADAEAASLAGPGDGAGGNDGSGGAGDGSTGGTPPAQKPKKKAPEGSAAFAARHAFADKPITKRYEFSGLPIAIENVSGSVREWYDEDGKVGGQTTMSNDYGFIEGHMGSDGEELDCYIGPDGSATKVYIVHQLKAPDFVKHDEDKIILGAPSATAAEDIYLAHRSDGAQAFGGMTTIPLERFKAKLEKRTGSGMIRASAHVEDRTFAAIMALSDRGVAAMKAAPIKRRGKATKDYPTALADKAVVLAARAMAPNLRAYKAEIANATSLDGLADAILAKYKAARPERDREAPPELVRLIQRVRLMSNMSGRLAIARGQ